MDSDESSDSLSTLEMYVIGNRMYGDMETGLDKWKNDLYKFVSEDFHNSLNSPNEIENKKANQEISLWLGTTNLTFFFKNSWGNDQNNKIKAMQYLNHAQMLEEKNINDQLIIEIIDRAIESCFENKIEFNNYWSE